MSSKILQRVENSKNQIIGVISNIINLMDTGHESFAFYILRKTLN